VNSESRGTEDVALGAGVNAFAPDDEVGGFGEVGIADERGEVGHRAVLLALAFVDEGRQLHLVDRHGLHDGDSGLGIRAGRDQEADGALPGGRKERLGAVSRVGLHHHVALDDPGRELGDGPVE